MVRKVSSGAQIAHLSSYPQAAPGPKRAASISPTLVTNGEVPKALDAKFMEGANDGE